MKGFCSAGSKTYDCFASIEGLLLYQYNLRPVKRGLPPGKSGKQESNARCGGLALVLKAIVDGVLPLTTF
jgi:hypothetical protein